MAKNPMQRKAQNSFLLGMLITLLVTGLIIGVLIIQLTKITKQQQEEKANMKQVYVVSSEIKSGDIVTIDKLKTQTLDSSLIPSNVLTSSELESKSNVTDEGGNLVKKVHVISKINLKPGTVITTDMVKAEGEIANDVRKVEYNVLVLPSQLETGEYIDVRISLPTGQDYIVVSKKQVEIPQINGVDSEDTIWLKLTEDEIITMNSAIVDTFRTIGATLKVVTYTEAGIQDAATPTYVPTGEVMQLINSNPNIVQQAKQELVQRYMTDQEGVRGNINSNISSSGEDGKENLKTKIEESVTNSKENRKKYLESLGGDY